MFELTLACGKYGAVRALADGQIQPEGLRLNWLDLPPNELMWRLLRQSEFDAAELSLPSYLIAREKGLDLRAIPVFPCRAFRHSSLYVRAAAGIEGPQDLKERRVGVPEYQMAAALWVRGILEHEYGIPPREIRWVAAGQVSAGRVDRLPLQLPPEIRIEQVADRTLNDLIAAGEIDAILSPMPPRAFMQGDGTVTQLFPNVRQVEMDYFRRTGIFPIMHTFVIRASVLDQHPWVAASLLNAFHQAKEHWYQSLWFEAAKPQGLPWMMETVQAVREVMGADFWPHGVRANQQALATAIRYASEQGLIRQPVDIPELFVPGVLEPATA